MTAEQAKTMRLTLFINPTGHHQAAWRHPRSQADAGVNFRHYANLAIAAERACFDAVFLADNQAVRSGDPAMLSRVAQYVANFEPLTLISALATVTERIGFIATASTSYNYPYQLARKLASIDHISGGRVGWNIVTSAMSEEAWNFNREEHFEHELRYERAAEFVDVCKGLWDSWEDDAFPRDSASGVFLRPERMHPLNHAGKYFRVRGPLNVPRAPQGYPLFVQAGSSPTGVRFASRYADMVFVTPQTLESGQQRLQEIKAQATAVGRAADAIKVMPGLAVIVKRTRAEAEEEFARLQELLHDDVALNILSLKMAALELHGLALDEPLPLDAGPPPGAPGRYAFEQWYEIGQREHLTLRELARQASGSLAGMSVMGSGEEIADLMEEWFRGGAADGFNLQPAYLPGQFDDFVQFVLPELRHRGLVRESYDGLTLREHFGVSRPAWCDHDQNHRHATEDASTTESPGLWP